MVKSLKMWTVLQYRFDAAMPSTPAPVAVAVGAAATRSNLDLADQCPAAGLGGYFFQGSCDGAVHCREALADRGKGQ